METIKLDAGANQLLISIGGHVEKWILNSARVRAESNGPEDHATATISSDDIRQAFEVFLSHGITDVADAVLNDNEAMQPASRRAG